MTNKSEAATLRFLGIECGGTRTTALLVNGDQHVLASRNAGPANLRLLSDPQLRRHFRALSMNLPHPSSIAIGMAGARTATDWERIQRAAQVIWRGTPCVATNDLETALLAAPPTAASVRTLILSGTGSCCFGRTVDGRTAKMGGWGHLLGDKGSGYEIGLRALKAVAYYFDRDGRWPRLGQRLLRALMLNEPNHLIAWAQAANKTDISALAIEVFAAWAKRDRIAADILEGAAHSLAHDGVSCARKLAKPGTSVQFILAGGVLLKQPRFAAYVADELRARWPKAIITRLNRDSVWGAVELARREFYLRRTDFKFQGSKLRPPSSKTHITSAAGEQDSKESRLESLAQSPTEQRNPRSMNLCRLSLSKAIDLMLSEDERVPAAIRAEKPSIEKAIRLLVQSLRSGGRLFYVGAGTSGRLGVLDASECPPTFRTPPEMVQGLIAGGQRALWEAVEGAEDDSQAGALAVEFRGLNKRDIVVGIAASGRTPFVWGALRKARCRGARTVLVCFNPNLQIARAEQPDVVIIPRVGPEVLTGSTRLKCGTATKLILNMFTTLAMVRLGKVRSNLMIDVKASNVKLRDRAARIVQALTGVDFAQARNALVKCDWKIKEACTWLGRNQRDR
jgi:N-acetylmuramic acid 6-phosphate etherase